MAIPELIEVASLRPPQDYSLGAMRINAIRVALRRDEHNVHFIVPMTVVDVHAQWREIEIVFNDYMPTSAWDSLTEHMQKQIVRKVIMSALEHEVDEWLRYRGEVMNPPHRGG